MAGRLQTWAVMLVLASTAALMTSGQASTIGNMEWKLENTTQLTVCFAKEDLVDGIISLIVNSPEGIADYIGSKNSEDSKCADFSDEQLQLPDEETMYKFQVVEQGSDELSQAAYVSYSIAITQTFIKCSESEFARVTISNGNFSDDSCLPASEGLLVCYTTAQDPRVCVLGLDADDNPDLQVCVTQTPADSSGISAGVLSGLSLNYDDGSLTIAANPAALMELLYRPQEGNASVAACSAGSCALANFAPSTDLYELCAVYGDDNDAVTGVSTGIFQDLDLTVVDADTVLDFYFTNLYQERIYEVYTGSSVDTVFAGDPIKLDCTGVPAEYPCYGFLVIGEAVPGYLAVGDINQTNAVITPAKTSDPTTANPGAV